MYITSLELGFASGFGTVWVLGLGLASLGSALGYGSALGLAPGYGSALGCGSRLGVAVRIGVVVRLGVMVWLGVVVRRQGLDRRWGSVSSGTLWIGVCVLFSLSPWGDSGPTARLSWHGLEMFILFSFSGRSGLGLFGLLWGRSGLVNGLG